MLQNLPVLMSSTMIGIILFQSMLVAPAINRLINTKDASIFLRFIWPKFFMIIAVLSAISIIGLFVFEHTSPTTLYLMIASLVFMLGCYFVTPAINHAKDTGNTRLWSILHKVTVFTTLIVLILNILSIVYWNFVL